MRIYKIVQFFLNRNRQQNYRKKSTWKATIKEKGEERMNR